MGLKDDNPTSSPTVEELILQLRSSFFAAEFQQVAKTLTEREERMKEKYLNLKKKVEKEKDAIFKENLKLKDELKKKDKEIEAMRKRVAEYEAKVRVYDNPFDDDLAESCRRPLFREKGSKRKTGTKLHKIINLDDDDDQGKQVPNETKREYNSEDDDLEVISSIKRRRVEREMKRTRGSKEMKGGHDDESAKISPCLGKIDLDSPEPDPGLDDETVDELYKSTSARVKKQEGWKLESDMVKDLEKDDELCLNGVCALQRQRIIVHWSDTSRLPALARMLIDGDPQNELKKKASDLNHLDLEECRMYAKKYSLQLFNIYLDKCDPFFPTSRSQEQRSDKYY